MNKGIEGKICFLFLPDCQLIGNIDSLLAKHTRRLRLHLLLKHSRLCLVDDCVEEDNTAFSRAHAANFSKADVSGFLSSGGKAKPANNAEETLEVVRLGVVHDIDQMVQTVYFKPAEKAKW